MCPDNPKLSWYPSGAKPWTVEVLQRRFKVVMQLSHLCDSMVHDLVMNLITALEVSPHGHIRCVVARR